MTGKSQPVEPVASSQPEKGKAAPTGVRRAFSAEALPYRGLAAALLLGSFLRFYRLGAAGIGNTYYAATVQSMLTSWHNFFYASFEPGGSVTVDKPPFGFWVQALSASIFGVNGFALALPQAVAGVLSILVLFFLVKRHFGAGAGLIAALSLAVLPVAVSTERNNTIDGLLVLVLVLSAWAVLEAAERGKLRYLLLGAALLGLGFNIKMLQAYMILPALFLVYLLGSSRSAQAAERASGARLWLKRSGHLAIAAVVLALVSFTWAIVVDLTPPQERPYIGSSQDNTVLGLITGHNGLSRLFAGRRLAQQDRPQQPAGPDAPGGSLPPAGARPPFSPPPDMPGRGQQPPLAPGGPRPGPFPGQGAPQPPLLPGQGNPSAPQSRPPLNPVAPSGGPPGGRSAEVGQAGWLRLFREPLDIEASWLLPMALLGIPLILALVGWQRQATGKLLGVLLWGSWLLPELIYFTFTSGLFHAYYLIMLGPPLSALVGAAAWALWRVIQRRRWSGWALTGLVSGVTLGCQTTFLWRYPQFSPWLLASASIIWLAGMLSLALASGGSGSSSRTAAGKAALALVCFSLIVAPLTWAGLTAVNTLPDVNLPRSGPLAGNGARRPPAEDRADDQQALIDFLTANTDPDSYLVATVNAREASTFILATQRPVLTLGGFTGSDPILGPDELSEMVEGGELRYVLGGESLERQKPEIAAWVRGNCAPVQGLEFGPRLRPGVQPPGPARGFNNSILFDCRSINQPG